MIAPAILAASIEDASSPTFISEWGPLIGVIVGAVLGGLAQVISGYIERHQERARENRERIRAAYTGFLHTLDDYQNFMMTIDTDITAGRLHLTDPDRISEVSHAFQVAIWTVQINGSRAAREMVLKIRDEMAQSIRFRGDAQTAAMDRVDDMAHDLMDLIRRDLKIKDR